jgi:flagellar motility protein MotE (MotC chaperone)
MTFLQKPVVFASVGVCLGIGLGVTLAWRTASVLLEQALVAAPPADAGELKSKGWDFWTIEIENLASELKDERAKLKKQSELLEQRAGRLAAEEKEFAKLRAEVESIRQQIADRLIEINADEAKNLRSLAATYSNLSPRGAVAILKEMEDGTAVKILSLMKPDVVGPIFEEMTRTTDEPLSRRAAMLSEKLRLMKANKAAPNS